MLILHRNVVFFKFYSMLHVLTCVNIDVGNANKFSITWKTEELNITCFDHLIWRKVNKKILD